MNGIEPGKIIKGTVSGIKPYGIFVNFENGYSGMIHISEISNKFVKDINEYAKIGEIVPCRVLEVNEQTKKIKLTIKNLDYELRRESSDNAMFQSLKEMLPIWMDEKLKEINEK